jgi:hypothetical protein
MAKTTDMVLSRITTKTGRHTMQDNILGSSGALSATNQCRQSAMLDTPSLRHNLAGIIKGSNQQRCNHLAFSKALSLVVIEELGGK